MRIRFFCLARPKIQHLRSDAESESGTCGPLGKKINFTENNVYKYFTGKIRIHLYTDLIVTCKYTSNSINFIVVFSVCMIIFIVKYLILTFREILEIHFFNKYIKINYFFFIIILYEGILNIVMITPVTQFYTNLMKIFFYIFVLLYAI